MRKIALLVASALSLGLVSPMPGVEPPTVQWQTRFGGTNWDFVSVIRTTSDDGFVVAGYSDSPISGNKTSLGYGSYDFWVLRLDRNGQKLWERSYGGSGSDILVDLQLMPDGDFVLAGRSASPPSGSKTAPLDGNSDFWIIRVTADGTTRWDKAFGDFGSETAMSVLPLLDGGMVVSGHVNYLYQRADWLILRLDADGNRIWERLIASDEMDQSPRIVLHPFGGFLVVGESRAPAEAGDFYVEDWWLLRLDESGDKLWERYLGGRGYDRVSSLAVSDGGFLIGGSSNSGTGPYKKSAFRGGEFMGDFWLTKVDLMGEVVWEETFGGEGDELVGQAIPLADGGVIAAGGSASPPSGNKSAPFYGGSFNGDGWIVRVDRERNLLWDLALGGTDNDGFYSAAQTSDGGFIVAGSLASTNVPGLPAGYGLTDFWIVKLGPDAVSNPLKVQPVAAQSWSEIQRLGFRLQLSGVSNRIHVVERSTDLKTWEGFATNRLSGSALEIVDWKATNSPAGFYRVRLET